jgi:phosphoribosylanthranilate isomerase
MVDIKFCGINDITSAEAAAALKVQWAGFVFHPTSPRVVKPEHARELAAVLPSTTHRVAVIVNLGDDLIRAITQHFTPTHLQLHGSETPERAQHIKKTTGCKIIKALSVATAADIAKANDYENVANWLLFDAKPPAGATLEGGNGVAFDWSLLQDIAVSRPWFLSGGLTSENVAEAINTCHPKAVDVSSGIEATLGVKSVEKMEAFAKAVRGEK